MKILILHSSGRASDSRTRVLSTILANHAKLKQLPYVVTQKREIFTVNDDSRGIVSRSEPGLEYAADVFHIVICAIQNGMKDIYLAMIDFRRISIQFMTRPIIRKFRWLLSQQSGKEALTQIRHFSSEV